MHGGCWNVDRADLMVVLVDSRCVRVPEALALAPIAWVALSGSLKFRAVLRQLDEVLAVLAEVDVYRRSRRVILNSPVRVGREVGANEVVVPVRPELDLEIPLWMDEAPLAVEEGQLRGAERPLERHLAPALRLANCRSRGGLARKIDHELVLPELAPVDVQLVLAALLLQLPRRLRLELGAEEAVLGAQVHLEVAARVLEVVHTLQRGHSA
mmetsp:Transcript_7690/g.16027  ORF Transcript_7690/g.16027 Transcript_7690/m.16027 type:complete len:212 (+) Transcript_7690:256-891(+)